MAVQPIRRQFTVTEYYQMAEAGILNEDDRVELIEGEIIQMAPIGDWHAARVDRNNQLLVIPLAGHAQVRVQNPLRLDDRSEPMPDLMLLRPRADFYASGHPRPADVLLLIEVADTTGSYDRGTKLPLYAHNGIPEVWLVEFKADLITVCREPTPDGYRLTLTLRRGDRLSPMAFPDLELLVDDILG